MICIQCAADDGKLLPDDLPFEETVRQCREWLCKRCRRTPEEVQSDFDAEDVKWRKQNKPAHDFGVVPNA